MLEDDMMEAMCTQPLQVKVKEKTMIHPVIRMTGKRERKEDPLDAPGGEAGGDAK